MKFLLCHNHYQQRGGEDQVFADEVALLRDYGHEVVCYTLHNDAIDQMGRIDLALRTVWNRQSYRELLALIRREKPVLMHCTNTFPLISPAAYSAAKAEGVAVVQSLHNYRLMCPKATLVRDGQVCEDCVGRLFAMPAIRHKCYRENRLATATLAGMTTFHRLFCTLHRNVDRFIALTEFGRRKFLQAGFSAERFAVKPNFVSPELGMAEGTGGYAVFVGRLSTEKGIDTLLTAWAQNPALLPLKIVGDGPMAEVVRAAAETDPRITWMGGRPAAETQQIIGDAALLVFPSVWYEGLPKTIIEAFSRGTPVVASQLGAMTELIDDDRTGLLFEAGNSFELAAMVLRLTNNRSHLEAMRQEARREFEDHYTAERNYQLLMRIYADALRSHGNVTAANQALVEVSATETAIAKPDLGGTSTTECDIAEVEVAQ